ncbi:hypothetical protein HGRIS_005456 [Hohenbuehelia grisea]|uniref:Uncharacterized protein n=1 Tax=Hohenbuehelia grisea TaxID=104357 RepID=A0ABR3JXS4_9AGAR
MTRNLVIPVLMALFSTTQVIASCNVYSLQEDIVGKGFYDAFDDPTHGRVQYVNQKTAVANNLTYASDDTFVLRADHKKTLTQGGPGRESVRIRSKQTYKTHV